MKKIRTEERVYKEYKHTKSAIRNAYRARVGADGREVVDIPMGDILRDIVENFRRTDVGGCPFYSDIIDTCGYDEFADLLQDMTDTEKADTIGVLFGKLVPAERAIEAIQRCGSGFACDGTPIGVAV